jgi:hypothetical protein
MGLFSQTWVLPAPNRCHSKFSWFLRSLSRFCWCVQTQSLSLHGSLPQSSALSVQWHLSLVASPGVGPEPNSHGGKNDNFGLSHSWEMHQKCCGKRQEKQSHWDHFAASRNFIMLADSWKISLQSHEPWSLSGDGLYTPREGYVNKVFL